MVGGVTSGFSGILAVNRADLAESFYAVLRSVRVHPSSIESSRAHNVRITKSAYQYKLVALLCLEK